MVCDGNSKGPTYCQVWKKRQGFCKGTTAPVKFSLADPSMCDGRRNAIASG